MAAKSSNYENLTGNKKYDKTTKKLKDKLKRKN